MIRCGASMPKSKVSFEKQFRRFLEQKPLLVWEQVNLPQFETELEILNIEMPCPQCQRERPFKNHEGWQRRQKQQKLAQMTVAASTVSGHRKAQALPTTKQYTFHCAGCNESNYEFWVEIKEGGQAVRKLGQHPPWSIKTDKEVDKFLGNETAAFYKNGLICESQGYGIAAFIYYRRVVEDSVSKLIGELRELLVSQGADDKLLAKLDKATGNKRMEDRIQIVKDLLPSHLRPNGLNPLGIIYDVVSSGIHRKSEEECIESAYEIRTSLEFLVKSLSTAAEEQKGYIKAMRKLERGGGKERHKQTHYCG